MENAKDIYKDEELVKDNLKKHRKVQQVLSEEALLHQSDATSLSQHNIQYTALLKAYVKDFERNSDNKRRNKEDLFKIAKMLLTWIPILDTILIFLTLVCLAWDRIDIFEALPGLFTAMTSLLGTFMVVPKMITKYLFNKNEEEHLANIISKIQEYDKNIREGL